MRKEILERVNEVVRPYFNDLYESDIIYNGGDIWIVNKSDELTISVSYTGLVNGSVSVSVDSNYDINNIITNIIKNLEDYINLGRVGVDTLNEAIERTKNIILKTNSDIYDVKLKESKYVNGSTYGTFTFTYNDSNYNMIVNLTNVESKLLTIFEVVGNKDLSYVLTNNYLKELLDV